MSALISMPLSSEADAFDLAEAKREAHRMIGEKLASRGLDFDAVQSLDHAIAACRVRDGRKYRIKFFCSFFGSAKGYTR